MASAAIAMLCAGCASAPEAEGRVQQVRFAVLGAPRLGTPAAEDALLEAVTLLSLEPDLDFCLVPGPLFDADADPETAHEALTGALGSLACRVYAAPGPGDGPPEDLLAALERGLPGQPARLSYAGEAVQELRPVVLAADGAAPEGLSLEPGQLPLALAGGEVGARRWSLTVRSADEPGISVGVSGVELHVPALGQPPHVFGIGRWDGDAVTVEWRQTGAGTLPQAPPPIQLTAP